MYKPSVTTHVTHDIPGIPEEPNSDTAQQADEATLEDTLRDHQDIVGL
jgi:hypothetical protein